MDLFYAYICNLNAKHGYQSIQISHLYEIVQYMLGIWLFSKVIYLMALISFQRINHANFPKPTL